MPYSTYLDTSVNKLAFGATSWSPPATLYVGLSTATPSKSGSGVAEPGGGSYARVSVTNNTTNWGPSAVQPSSGQQQENKTTITFPTATADWGTVRYFLIYDASSGGNFLGFGLLDTARAVISGDTARFQAGALKLIVD